MELAAYSKTPFGEPRRLTGRNGYVAYFPALKLPRQLEGVGVLQEGSVGPHGRRRYLAPELMAAVAEESRETHK